MQLTLQPAREAVQAHSLEQDAVAMLLLRPRRTLCKGASLIGFSPLLESAHAAQRLQHPEPSNLVGPSPLGALQCCWAASGKLPLWGLKMCR